MRIVKDFSIGRTGRIKVKLLLMIQDILEKHKYAILRTADALLPFSVYYQPDNFITSKFNPEGYDNRRG